MTITKLRKYVARQTDLGWTVLYIANATWNVRKFNDTESCMRFLEALREAA